MKSKYTLALLAVAMAQGAYAKNVTIFDGQGYNGTSYTKSNKGSTATAEGNYFNGAGSIAVGKQTREVLAIPAYHPQADEDQETEPGTPNWNIVASQIWDLEAFITTGNRNMALVGGFNYYSAPNSLYSGDIFIDINGDAVYGPSAASVPLGQGETLGYEYAIRFDRSSLTSGNPYTGTDFLGNYNSATKVFTGSYDVIDLRKGSPAELTVSLPQNTESNPWRLKSGGSAVDGFQNVGFSVQAGLTDSQTGFLGDDGGAGSHYSLAFNLDFLRQDEFENATLHFTMNCGNDNIIGHVPDGGTTLALLGLGIGGLAFVSRRNRK